jgi:hypothetical protein
LRYWEEEAYELLDVYQASRECGYSLVKNNQKLRVNLHIPVTLHGEKQQQSPLFAWPIFSASKYIGEKKNTNRDSNR